MADRSFSTSVSRVPNRSRLSRTGTISCSVAFSRCSAWVSAALLCRSSVSAESTLNWLSIASRSPAISRARLTAASRSAWAPARAAETVAASAWAAAASARASASSAGGSSPQLGDVHADLGGLLPGPRDLGRMARPGQQQAGERAEGKPENQPADQGDDGSGIHADHLQVPN